MSHAALLRALVDLHGARRIPATFSDLADKHLQPSSTSQRTAPPSSSTRAPGPFVVSGLPGYRVAGTVMQGGAVDKSGKVEYHLRNPAGRLYLFFVHCESHAPGLVGTLQSVAEYFGLPPHQFTPELFRALSELTAQPDLMRASAVALEPSDQRSDLLKVIPEVEEALGHLLGGLIHGHPKDFLTMHDGAITSRLEAASRALNGARTIGSPITSDRLSNLKDLAQAIIDTLADDDAIDGKLRSLLFHHAARIREAVELYKIGGLEAVLAEFDRLRGTLERSPESTALILQKPKLKDRVGALLLALNVIAGLGNTAVALEQGAGAIAELMAPLPETVLAPDSSEPA